MFWCQQQMLGGKKDPNGPKAAECSKTPVPNIPQVNRMIGSSWYQNCSRKAAFERGCNQKCINSTTTVINATSWNRCCAHCENIQTHLWNNVKLHKRNERIAIKAWPDLWFFQKKLIWVQGIVTLSKGEVRICCKLAGKKISDFLWTAQSMFLF